MAAENETILVVDDEPEVRQVLAGVLEGKGYVVLQADDGDIAGKLLEQRFKELGMLNIKVIISDLAMPRKNGIELLKMIRQSPYKDVPFVLMSGAVTRDELMNASKFDPDAILLKPFSATAVLQKIERALETREGKEIAKLLRNKSP
ncbi:MAG: response regulator [Deltaproteobacteria bacterium]|nr:response regulator [Deltaproteobacteria bacterium]